MADPPLILVVDDEQSYRDALSIALQREGFLVETAADGPEAIERFDATRPALVLLDVMLPKISGVDVCRDPRPFSRCRSSWSRRATPRSTRSSGSRSAPTTTSRSRSACASSSRACVRRCAGFPRPTTTSPTAPRCSRSATSASTPAGTRCSCAALRSRSAQGVRAPRAPAGQRRPGAHARRAHRPHLGPELLRRHQDARRAHQAAAVEARSRLRARPGSSRSAASAIATNGGYCRLTPLAAFLGAALEAVTRGFGCERRGELVADRVTLVRVKSSRVFVLRVKSSRGEVVLGSKARNVRLSRSSTSARVSWECSAAYLRGPVEHRFRGFVLRLRLRGAGAVLDTSIGRATVAGGLRIVPRPSMSENRTMGPAPDQASGSPAMYALSRPRRCCPSRASTCSPLAIA